MSVSGLWDLNKKKVDELLYLLVLFGVVEMKDSLDKTGMIEMAKYCMHWNVALDALPGSARLVCVWTTGLTTVSYDNSPRFCWQ